MALADTQNAMKSLEVLDGELNEYKQKEIEWLKKANESRRQVAVSMII